MGAQIKAMNLLSQSVLLHVDAKEIITYEKGVALVFRFRVFFVWGNGAVELSLRATAGSDRAG